MNKKNKVVYFLDLSFLNNTEDLFIKVRDVLPLDPDLSDEEAIDGNWDALNDCIGGGIYILLDMHKKFIVCVKGIECFSEKSPLVWLFLDILKEAFKNIEKSGRCEIIYIK